MQGTTLSFSNIHHHGDLFANILKVRRPAPAAQSWDLPQPQSTDYDQYDTPQSRWLAVQDEDGSVLASLRLTPTTAQSGVYSYMVRDAQNGLLDNLPSDLLDGQAPVDKTTWEVSRGFIAGNLPFQRRQSVRDGLLRQLLKTCQEENISDMLALLPASWQKWARKSGLEMRGAGRVFALNGTKYQTMWLNCVQPAP